MPELSTDQKNVAPQLLKLILCISLPLYILDQISKWWIVLNFTEHESRTIIEGVFYFTRVHNQGVAFGMGNGSSWAPLFFLLLLPCALTLVVVLWKKNFFPGRLGATAAPLLIAGITGNFTDRLFQGFWLDHPEGASFWDKLMSGYVVDFLDVVLPLYEKIAPKSGGHWPTFNVADSCIVIAATCLFLSSFFIDEEEEAKKRAKQKPAAE